MAAVGPLQTGVAQEAGADAAEVVRVGGTSRVDTAVAASRAYFDMADEIILATARNYPDALAAGPLARVQRGPILLTEPGALPDSVAAEIRRLGATRVTIVGLEGAVPSNVESDVRALGVEVRRLGGVDRYETARLIAAEIGAPDGRVTVALGRGRDAGSGFADALTAGTIGMTDAVVPTLLTATDTLPPPTREALEAAGGVDATIIGGEAAVSAGVESQVDDLVRDVERLFGASRYATSVVVADAISRGVREPEELVVATGAAFPDSLVAGALTGRLQAPIVLVPPRLTGGPGTPSERLSAAHPEVANHLVDVCPTVRRVVILGLEGAVSAEVEGAINQLLTCSKAPPAEPLTVQERRDGDSFVASDGVEYRVGMINTPEMSECGGPEAADQTYALLADGFTVEAYSGDNSGRSVARVHTVEGTDLGVWLARNGWADDRYLDGFRHEYPAYARELDDAFAAAEAEGAGLWGSCWASPPSEPSSSRHAGLAAWSAG